MGTQHILDGLDHVLFVVALLLGASGFVALLTIASAFTLAHSIALALAVLGWVRVPGEIVEPLIASLLSFNVGIELGQALIIALAFPLLLLARRWAWSGAAQLAATAAIGRVWFVERMSA